ncbi:beta-1,3-galactosyl-O-glycosyl-glycoprotein beta-1,6-N-acetylglucosaminyltransferase 4-like isoform X2 [Hyperolius riggenbachi]|uniref:beta-1,3-galactosyl-O-glycosyl-glycoprotein beta-1,6-N-acetylglucosaminyltransferase 4-like isoform X2 n=1 Tax=Hyperolius riggenbachi TaxID=752182 RepID=UPI0035A37648
MKPPAWHGCDDGPAANKGAMPRMKILRCCSTFRVRQKLWFFICALSLPVVLKIMIVELIPPKSQSYFVDPNLYFSVVTNSGLLFDPSTSVDCTAIFELKQSEIQKSVQLRKRHIYDLKDEMVSEMTKNCTTYKNLREYHHKVFSKEELEFPIAYSMVVHKNAINVERLLHTIYSPANVYCIHYDLKSSPEFQNAMTNLASCFPNVFIASKLEKVIYAHFSRLQADLNCLSDLLSSPVQWKYVINLCGQDMPIKSNYELVSELKKLNGKNMLETIRPSHYKKKRYMYHHKLMFSFRLDYMIMPLNTYLKKTPPPFGIEMFSGSAYFVLSHAFIKYIFGSPLVKEFVEWCKDTFSPDEHFWATLVRLPGVPGEIPRSQDDVTDFDSKTRLVNWVGEKFPCSGAYLRGVCIYGAAELQWLIKSEHWFGNKFDPKVDPVSVECLIGKLGELQREGVSKSAR